MDPTADDVLDFAEYLGLTGIDRDLYYESYYGLDNRDLEADFIMEHYENNYPS